jgi:hypothetical protein
VTSSSSVATAAPSRSNRARSSARCSRQSRSAARSDRVAARLEKRLRGDLEHDEVVAAPAQVEQRADRALVEQRGEGHDERARGQRPRRDDVDVLPGVAELDARLEQRVDEAVPLHEPASGLEPAKDPAERDETDPVPPLEEA